VPEIKKVTVLRACCVDIVLEFNYASCCKLTSSSLLQRFWSILMTNQPNNHWIRRYSGQGVKLGIHRHLVLRLRIRKIIPALRPHAFVKYKGQLKFYLTNKMKMALKQSWWGFNRRPRNKSLHVTQSSITLLRIDRLWIRFADS